MIIELSLTRFQTMLIMASLFDIGEGKREILAVYGTMLVWNFEVFFNFKRNLCIVAESSMRAVVSIIDNSCSYP